MTEVALSLRTCVVACVCGPKHAYTGIFLRMQLGFQKYNKDKFFAMMRAKACVRRHIPAYETRVSEV